MTNKIGFLFFLRLSTLLKEIMAEKENKTIVFIETKRRVDEITRKMKRDGWPAVCIHGDKSQQERDWVLQGKYHRFRLLYRHIVWSKLSHPILSFFFLIDFRSGKTPILVATDVAARGLGKH